MYRGAWQATVHWVTESQKRLSGFHTLCTGHPAKCFACFLSFIYFFLRLLFFFFLMWTIFKVFTEFVTVSLLCYVLDFWPQDCGILAP